MAEVTKPRNRLAHANGQRTRELLRELLAAHPPLEKPLTLPLLQECLRARGVYLARSTIAWHRERIWAEALGCKSSDSSNAETLLA